MYVKVTKSGGHALHPVGRVLSRWVVLSNQGLSRLGERWRYHDSTHNPAQQLLMEHTFDLAYRIQIINTQNLIEKRA
jgi:hypothetical protein